MNWLLNLFRRKSKTVVAVGPEWHVWRDWKAAQRPLNWPEIDCPSPPPKDEWIDITTLSDDGRREYNPARNDYRRAHPTPADRLGIEPFGYTERS